MRQSDMPPGSKFVHPVHGLCKVVYIPCGGCLSCRRERRQELTLLQCCEASLYDDNWFLTLTYDDEKLIDLEGLPAYSLEKKHLQDFCGSMRKYCAYRSKIDKAHYTFRFYACGEYGDTYGRPHYHLSIFGLPSKLLGIADDSEGEDARRRSLSFGRLCKLHPPLTDENGNEYWKSSIVSDRWPYGNHQIYRANRSTFQYVAGYVTKKLTGDLGRTYRETGRVPPFSLQSRPSIGFPWFIRNYASLSNDRLDGTLENDCLAIADVEWKIPRIFGKWLERLDHFDGKKVKERISALRQLLVGEMPDRADLKRKSDFEQYRAAHYKQENKHKEIQ